jgi:hypothetical protein
MTSESSDWPELTYASWQDTYAALHLWTQVAGKIRLAKTPWLNHSWHVTLYVTPRGLTTSQIQEGARGFELLFDFVSHEFRVETSDGQSRKVPLRSQSVADFYAQVCSALETLGITARIRETPNEIANALPFSQDRAPRIYRPEEAERFWKVLRQADRLLQRFRSGFIGKASPVHFFWGSFDHAVTRFSGRRAPQHPGGIPNLPDSVAREAYSHEVSSAGFWPGSAETDAVFYSYAYPEPKGFRDQVVRPDEASFDAKLGEFVLPYAAVRRARDPDARVMEFLQSTYEAAARLGQWDRAALECELGVPGVPRALNL